MIYQCQSLLLLSAWMMGHLLSQIFWLEGQTCHYHLDEANMVNSLTALLSLNRPEKFPIPNSRPEVPEKQYHTFSDLDLKDTLFWSTSLPLQINGETFEINNLPIIKLV